MKRVLLPRPAGRDEDAELLREIGFEPVSDPYIEVFFLNDEKTIASLIAALEPRSYQPTPALVLTSSRALISVAAQLTERLDVSRIETFAIGPTTAATCLKYGLQRARSPKTRFDHRGLLELLEQERPASIVLPRSGAASDSFVEKIEALGIGVTAATTYDTRTVAVEPVTVAELRRGEFDAVVVRSGSAARALRHFVPDWPQGTKIVAGGDSTAAVLVELGLPVAITSQDSTSFSVVDGIAAILG